MHKFVSTHKAPKAVGPYSQAVIAAGGSITFVSGQIPLNPETMTVEVSSVREQTRVVLENLQHVLHAADLSRAHVVKTTVYLKDMNDFAAVNEEYAKFFGGHRPARACVEVARLPKDVLIEIDAIAVRY